MPKDTVTTATPRDILTGTYGKVDKDEILQQRERYDF